MTLSRRLQPLPTLWLTAVWVLLWGELTPANVLSGLVLAVLVLVTLPLPRLNLRLRLRPWPALLLVASFLRAVVTASVQVAWLAVRPAPVPRGSVVVVTMRSPSEFFQTIIGEMMSLVPGSLVVDLEPGGRRLAMHVLGVETAEQAEDFRARMLQFEDRLLHAFSSGDGAEPAARP